MFIGAILLIVVISIANMFINAKGYSELVNEQRMLVENSVHSQLRTAAAELLEVSKLYANNQELLEALEADEREEIAEITKHIYERLVREHHFEVFEIGDENGTVYYRAHNPGDFGDDKSDEPAIQTALSGEPAAGFAIGNSGLNIRAFLPLDLDGEVIGTLQTGIDDTFLTHIISNLEEVSIHLYDINGELLETSESGHHATIDPTTLKEVLTGETIVKEQDHMLHTYLPMFEPTQSEMIGFIQITQDISSIYQMMDQNKWNALVITTISFILVVILSVLFSRSISKPVKQAAAMMDEIAKGNLRKGTIHYKGKDEIKILVDSVNKMKDNLREMIRNVIGSSEDVLYHSEELNQSANEVKEGSEQIAATMEELCRPELKH